MIKFWNQKKNYIKLEKAKLLDVLAYVDIKELTCPYLLLLWAQICSTWKKIEWYEDLSKKLDVSQKIDAYSKAKKVEKLFPLDKLWFNEVKIKIEIQEELLSMILNLFIHSLDKLSWKEIIDVWNTLINLWEKISKLEDINIY